MAGSNPFAKPAHPPELVTFLERVSHLVEQEDYRGVAEATAAFAKAHDGLLFFVKEALPSRVANQVLKKTGAPSAFTTYTLRHPTWATELGQTCTDPDAFSALVASIEAGVLATAKPKAA